MEYIIVQAGRDGELMAEVTKRMTEGFTLVGGVSLAVNSTGWVIYAQAMVRQR